MNKNVNKPRLFIYETTLQSPHLEANYYYIDNYKNDYSEIILINLMEKIKYKHEYNWRRYLSIKLNISRKLRNGLNKYFYLIYNKFKYRDIVEFDILKDDINGDNSLTDEDVFNILKTYSATEWKSAAIKLNKYTYQISNDVKIISKIVNSNIKKYKIKKLDKILIFNGRMPVELAIIKTLKKFDINNIIFHECNNYQNKVFFSNNSPHDLSSNDQKIKIFAEKISYIDIEKYISNKIFANIEKNIEKKYITYYTSSTDEYSFFYDKPIEQSKIIKILLSINFGKYYFKIRVHPNTKNKSLESKQYWDQLKSQYPNIVINYDDKFSSYDLCVKSIFTISMGSSMAAESLLLNTKHLLIGNQNFYFNLPGYFHCSENNLILKINELLKIENKNIYKEVTREEKILALSAILFEKKDGIRIPIAILGKYPTPEVKV